MTKDLPLKTSNQDYPKSHFSIPEDSHTFCEKSSANWTNLVSLIRSYSNFEFLVKWMREKF